MCAVKLAQPSAFVIPQPWAARGNVMSIVVSTSGAITLSNYVAYQYFKESLMKGRFPDM